LQAHQKRNAVRADNWLPSMDMQHFGPAFDAVHGNIIRIHRAFFDQIASNRQNRSWKVCDHLYIQKIVLNLAAIFLMFSGTMFVPIAFFDLHRALSKQWCDAVAMRNGALRSVGKGTSS
jgi:hypothetical protein